MKKLISVLIICGSLACLVSCTSFFKKTDSMMEDAKKMYIESVSKADGIFLLADSLDTSIYQPVKNIYWQNDTFTVSFKSLTNQEQESLMEANDAYLKIREEGVRLYKDYIEIQRQAVKGYFQYYKIRDTSIKIENFLKKLPLAIGKISPYLKDI